MTNLADTTRQPHSRSGLLYGLGAYGLWGLMPLYFRTVRNVPPQEILAHRIVWCGLLLALILTLARRWSSVAICLAASRTSAALFLCSLLLAVNWFTYIFAALNNSISQASLGYFMLPLFSVIFGLLVFRERLRPAQWLSVALAAAGVAYLVGVAGNWPWISLCIAISFTAYGVLRKLTPVDGLVGLFVETLFLAPVAAGFLLWWSITGQGTFATVDARTNWLLLLSGPLTAAPLVCFGQAARRLPLTALGFLQYLSPTLQLLLAICVDDEPFKPELRVCFGCIWAALAMVTVDSMSRVRSQPPEVLVTDE